MDLIEELVVASELSIEYLELATELSGLRTTIKSSNSSEVVEESIYGIYSNLDIRDTITFEGKMLFSGIHELILLNDEYGASVASGFDLDLYMYPTQSYTLNIEDTVIISYGNKILNFKIDYIRVILGSEDNPIIRKVNLIVLT